MEFGTDVAEPMNCVEQALERAPKPRPLVGGVKKELADFALETAPSLSLKTLSALDKAYHPPTPPFPFNAPTQGRNSQSARQSRFNRKRRTDDKKRLRLSPTRVKGFTLDSLVLELNIGAGRDV